MIIDNIKALTLFVCLLILIGLAAVPGCLQEVQTPQPTFYSPDENHIMFIPKGTRIGDIVAPEDGIFIGKSRIINMQIIEVPKDSVKKQKQKRT